MLIDHARRVRSNKRGGGKIDASAFEADGGAWQFDERVLAVDQALIRLEALDSRAAKVIEMRFFGGLTETEAAAALGISVATLDDDMEDSDRFRGLTGGVYVETIEADAPAYKSDLRPNDVITQVDGVPVLTTNDLQREVLRKKVGQSVDLSVWRAGKMMDIAIVTDELPADMAKVAENHTRAITAIYEMYGLELAPPAPEVERIDLDVFDVAYHIIGGGEEGDKTAVHTKEEADHSLQYMVAVALLDGQVLPAQYEPDRIGRAE